MQPLDMKNNEWFCAGSQSIWIMEHFSPTVLDGSYSWPPLALPSASDVPSFSRGSTAFDMNGDRHFRDSLESFLRLSLSPKSYACILSPGKPEHFNLFRL